MPQPSKNWTDILDSQVDADSPLDTTLLTQIRDNLVNLCEWLGLSYTPAADHDHDGINSKSVVLADGAVVTAKLADANVTLAKLKMAQGSYALSITSGTFNISIPQYTHLPQTTYTSGDANDSFSTDCQTTSTTSGSHRYLRLTADIPSSSLTVYWDYHTN